MRQVRQLSGRFVGGIVLVGLLLFQGSGTAVAQQQTNRSNANTEHKGGAQKNKQQGKGKGRKGKHSCEIRVGKPARRGHRVKGHIELEVVNQSDALLNFGGHRSTKRDVILLKTSRRLPKKVRPGQFELDTLIPLRRIGSETEESVELTRPKYSRVHIFDHRERISFAVCVDAKNGKAGTFAGQYLLSGPTGISSATITQTAQLKRTGCEFAVALLIALGVTGIALWITRIAPAEEGKPTTGQRVTVLLGLGTAAAAMVLVYSETPTWGADWFPSVAALVGTGFVAAGVGSIASSGATRADLGKFSEYFPSPRSSGQGRASKK